MNRTEVFGERGVVGAIYSIRAVDETPHVMVKARIAGLDGQDTWRIGHGLPQPAS